MQATARLEPDLLLMDVQMPLMNGLAAASVVFVGFPLTSTVLMSAEDSPQLRAACLASGARAFIHKPHFRQDLAGVRPYLSGRIAGGNRRALIDLCHCVRDAMG